MKYLITYDLRRPVQQYQTLIKALEDIHAIHVMQSVWFVNVNEGANAIYAYLKGFIDNNDLIFITSIGDYRGVIPQNGINFLNG